MTPQDRLGYIARSLGPNDSPAIVNIVKDDALWLITRVRALEAALEKIIQDDTCEYTLETARKALLGTGGEE
jgi:hypothetical protein